MIFTKFQIQQLMSILKKYELIFITNQLGVEFLTEMDKKLLSRFGIDVSKFENKRGVIEHAFLFGLLSEAIGDERAQKMNYVQFKKFISTGKFIPLNETERFALRTVKDRAYTDITNLGNRMQNSVANIALNNNQKQSLLVQKTIRREAIKASELRLSSRELASNLADATKDWEVDWLRIAYYLTHESFNSGRAQSILKNYGEDAKVYFDVYEGACLPCRKLYLEDPTDINSRPIIYNLKDIIANGNNIGRKVDDWLPTISPTHPYCRCTINNYNEKYEWDEELRAFSKPKKYETKNTKLKNVKLNIKVEKNAK